MKSALSLLAVGLLGFTSGQKMHHEVDFITYDDNVMVVDGKVGDDIHVRVKENPTTGFVWMVAKEQPQF